jgi:undecaprenyl-diphosphatase
VTSPDAPLTVWITGLVGKFPPLDWLMSLFVSDFFLPVLSFLVLIALWFGTRDTSRRERNQRAVLCAATGAGFTNLAVWMLNHVFRLNLWPRPFTLYESARHAAMTLFYFPHDPSFPSNAAAVSFALAFGIWFTNRKAGAVLFVLAFLWSFARVYCGVHYPLDIVGGVAVGFLVSYLTYKAFWPLVEPVLVLVFKWAKRLHLA